VHELKFYMEQMKIKCADPVDGIKTLHAQLSASQDDNGCLQQKVELLSLEMELQRKQHAEYVRLLVGEGCQQQAASLSRLDIDIVYTADSDESNDETGEERGDCRPPVFRSCARLAKQKTVTVPSFENNSFYVVETEGELREAEEKSFLGRVFDFGGEEKTKAEVVRIEHLDFGESRQQAEALV